MPKKIPMRKCVGCGLSKEKKSLVRVVRTPEGQVILDRAGRANGRGAYLCDDPKCLALAQKRKSLARAFGVEIPGEIYEELMTAISESGEAEADPKGGMNG